MDPIYTFNTAKGVGELVCVDAIEPNNGRMLYKVKLLINNLDQTHLYFEDINTIVFYLNDYVPVSEDKKWMYVPKESNHFVINTHNLQKISLPNLTLSAATFIKNFYYQHFLIVIASFEVIIKNLENNEVHTLRSPNTSIRFKDVLIGNNHTLNICSSNQEQQTFDLNMLD